MSFFVRGLFVGNFIYIIHGVYVTVRIQCSVPEKRAHTLNSVHSTGVVAMLQGVWINRGMSEIKRENGGRRGGGTTNKGVCVFDGTSTERK